MKEGDSMKKLIISLLLSVIFLTSTASGASAYVSVRGYYRNSGTYVAPHFRTYSNSYKFDNWSSRGNYNPYTGRRGYISPFN